MVCKRATLVCKQAYPATCILGYKWDGIKVIKFSKLIFRPTLLSEPISPQYYKASMQRGSKIFEDGAGIAMQLIQPTQ